MDKTDYLTSLFTVASINITITDPDNSEDKQTAKIRQLATDELEFRRIFNKEFDQTDLQGTIDRIQFFIKILSARVKDLITQHHETQTKINLEAPFIAERFLTWLDKEHAALSTGNRPIAVKWSDPLSFTAFIGLIEKYESYIPFKILEWNNSKDKTGCAIFCNYLLSKKLFYNNEVKTAKLFAFNRYGNEIGTMIDKIRKTENKDKFSEKTTEMKRLILNTPFGEI